MSPLKANGTARNRAADRDGAVLVEARRRKERTYPELSGEGGRARLVVLEAEAGGRWSTETAQFLSLLANARAQSEPSILRGRTAAVWNRIGVQCSLAVPPVLLFLTVIPRRADSFRAGGVAGRQVLLVRIVSV